MTFKADPQNLVGVVGFAQSFLFERKSDGELSTGDTMFVPLFPCPILFFFRKGEEILRLTVDVVKYSKSHGMEKGVRREERG